ncbi:MAG: TlpA disulfide reductase family protein [Actinobacteria bacterium]|jgi:thiol-disulfide isomerase/thioredoxin|nr:TlpA disulfide reductase family protein [Actinomycetota bacterium]
MRVRIQMAALTAVALLALTGCSSGSSSEATGTSFVAGDGSIVLLDPAERVAAPDLVGTTLDGQQLSSAGLAGDVLVVNVWASWCAPCRSEAPSLERLSKEFADQGVSFIGLNTRDSDTSARSFVERFGISYPNVVDRDGVLQLGFRDSLPPRAIPSTLVIDRSGRVAARVLGAVSESSLRGVIEAVADEKAG